MTIIRDIKFFCGQTSQVGTKKKEKSKIRV